MWVSEWKACPEKTVVFSPFLFTKYQSFPLISVKFILRVTICLLCLFICSTAIAKLLVDDKPKNGKQDYVIKGRHYSETTGVPTAPVLITESHLKEAGLAGRNGADCEVAYPTCEALDYVIGTNDIRKNSEKGPFRLPLLISPERSLAIILGQETFNPQGWRFPFEL